MANKGSASFHIHFQDLQDPRVERTRKHPLINVLFIAVCGVLSGANSFAAIYEFATDRRHWLARYLDLTNGIPSEDTLARVLARLDPGAFEKCLLGWIRAVQEATENRLIAIDGKTLRGSYDRADGRAAIHMVSAWATENKLSLGQVVVHEKSTEITAIPQLLGLLDVAGALVTIDAMGCQREIAAEIRRGEGDYILAVKQNQPTLYERVEAAIDVASEEETGGFEEHVTSEEGHGRQETRTYCARLIENSVHWQLDVSFREDECRVRRDHTPTNLSVIRRFALGLLKRETTCRRGIGTKRLKCAANDE